MSDEIPDHIERVNNIDEYDVPYGSSLCPYMKHEDPRVMPPQTCVKTGRVCYEWVPCVPAVREMAQRIKELQEKLADALAQNEEEDFQAWADSIADEARASLARGYYEDE